MSIVLLVIALAIVSGLAFYAGSLLFQLRSQKRIRTQKTQQRIKTISASIQTIAKAVEQEQCNLSEGCIRIYHLLEGLPILNKPDFSVKFPHLYSLYAKVKHLPTHEGRKEQLKSETRRQDMEREELESQMSTKIQHEMSQLKTFTI